MQVKILQSECDRELIDLNSGKASGIDNTPVELITSLGDEAVSGLFRIVGEITRKEEFLMI